MIKDNLRIIKSFFKLVKGHKKYVPQIFISSILGHSASLFLPIAAAQIIKHITENNFDGAYLWAIYLAGIYLVYNLFWYWNYYAYAHNFNYCYTNLQYSIINQVSNYDEEFTSHVSRGKLINTTNHDVVESSAFIDRICELIITFFKIIIIFIIFCSINIYVGVFVILVDLLYIILVDRANKSITKHLMGQRKYMDKISDIFSQTISGLREIKTFNIMPKLNHRFDIVKNKFERKYMQRRQLISKKYTLLPIIINFSKVIIYIVLIYFVSQNNLKIDIFILLIAYFDTVIGTTDDLLAYSSQMRDQSVSIDRVNSILNYKPKTKMEFGLNDNDYVYGLVEFNNVSFGYKDKLTLKDITFTSEPNRVTAVVGKTGSGKSTIINLLLRLYKVNSGEIYIDGENIYNYSKHIYSSNVSVVNQKPFIFNMSIRDNLGLVENNKTKIINACKRVGIHDFIMTLPHQYNTVLKEDATDVSGGQKQLISLARTLLSESEVLLFDEITSSLDAGTARHVASLLKDLKEDHTIIMVTHKPELMKKADKIIVLDNGKIVGVGTHENLLNDNKYYQKLQNKELNEEEKKDII